MLGIAPDLSTHFQFPFGCPVTSTKTEGRHNRFDVASEFGIAVGSVPITQSNRATLVYIPGKSRNGKIFERLDVLPLKISIPGITDIDKTGQHVSTQQRGQYLPEMDPSGAVKFRSPARQQTNLPGTMALEMFESAETHTTSATTQDPLTAQNSPLASEPTAQGSALASAPTTQGSALASAPTAQGSALASAPTAQGSALASAPIAQGSTLASAPTAQDSALSSEQIQTLIPSVSSTSQQKLGSVQLEGSFGKLFGQPAHSKIQLEEHSEPEENTTRSGRRYHLRSPAEILAANGALVMGVRAIVMKARIVRTEVNPTVTQAKKGDNWSLWSQTIDEELELLRSLGTGVQVRKRDVPPGIQIIPSKMDLKTKVLSSGMFRKRKARLVALGDQEWEKFEEDYYSPTVCSR